MATFDDVPGMAEPLRADARREADRQIVSFLRAQHLPGVDTDDEAALSLEIEQARLVMVAAGAVLAVATTQMLTLTRGICVAPLYFGLPLLVVALVGSWAALLMGARLRGVRVDRRYCMFRIEVNEHQAATREGRAVDHARMHDVWLRVIAREIRLRARYRWFRYVNMVLVGAGITAALWSAAGTVVPAQCPAALIVPPTIDGAHRTGS